MNDKLTASEIHELEEIAEWLDSVYVRLQGAEIAFAINAGNEQYCSMLQNDLERVVNIGISLSRPIENCSCLFEALNGDADPTQFIMRARAEVNAIAMALRQMAIDEHREAKQQPPTLDSSKYPGLKQAYRDAQQSSTLDDGEKSYRKVAERYRQTLNTINRPSTETLKRWLERPENH